MNQSVSTTGTLSMLMYVVITALSSIMIHNTNQQITPLLSAFYTFAVCLLAYNIMTKGLAGKITMIKRSWFPVLMLNLTTAICWLFSFFSLKWIPPELFLYVYLCAMPIASSLIYRSHLVKASVYLTGLIFLASTYHVDMLWLGSSLAFLGGASGTVYSIYSKQVTGHFSTLEILSLRFYLIVAFTLMLNFYFHHFQLMDIHFYLKFVALSFFSVIFPLMFFQMGIKHLNLNKAFAYLPLAPLLCYLINSLFNHIPIHALQLCAIIFISVALFLNI